MGKVKEEKALFTKRLMAFLIDFLIITFISSLFAEPFVDSTSNEKLSKELIAIEEKYTSREINTEEFIISYGDLIYSISRNNGVLSFIEMILYVLYFIVFQLYKGGQTIGKRMMKIKVISEDGDLSMNQMIFRSFLANSLIFSIIAFIFIIICDKNTYFYSYGFIEMIQYFIMFISSILVMFRKDGKALHDILVHTKVVNA